MKIEADVSWTFFIFLRKSKVIDFVSKFVYSSPQQRAKTAELIILFVEFLRS